MQEDEATLIEEAKRGNRMALSILLQRNYTFLVRYLIKVTLQPPLAEDLAQETMLRCLEKIRLYNGQAKFSSWLITIASRLYIDHIRKVKRENRLLEQEQAMRKLKWQSEREGNNWPEALEALGMLPEETRMPVILKHYYGYSYEEVAEMMNIPPGTVKSRIHHALKNLRKELAGYDEEAT